MHPFSIEVDNISSISQQRLDSPSTEEGESVDDNNEENERLRDKNKSKAKLKKEKKNKRSLDNNKNYEKEKRRVRFANR